MGSWAVELKEDLGEVVEDLQLLEVDSPQARNPLYGAKELGALILLPQSKNTGLVC